MKRLLSSGFLLLLLGTATAFSQEPKNETQGNTEQPTLAETINWIKDKLSNYADFTTKRIEQTRVGNRTVAAEFTTTHRIEQVSFDNCSFTFTYTESEYPGISIANKFAFQLGDMDSAMITATVKGDYYLVNFKTINGAKKIRNDYAWGASGRIGKTPSPTEWKNEASFAVKDEDIAKRLAKAFAHASTLCKAKKEPF